ncbi:RNA polymerase sigma factor [Patescibacteria group bacterium]
MNNSEKFFEELYDQYVDKIYRFIFLKVSSQELAEDLTSETFTKGWKSFQNPEDIKNPSAFLYRIARNLVIDYYRQKDQKRTVPAQDYDIPDPQSNLEEKAILNSDMEIVKAALNNINEDYQAIIVWRYLDDLSISEIAKTVDKSEGTVRVTLHRALKQLKKQLSKGVTLS